MRQVRTCDFCGDDATGLYEPLPPSVSEGPRLLLCDSCRDRLDSIIDPLVAQLEADGGTIADVSAPTPSATDADSLGSPPADQPTTANRPPEAASPAGNEAVVGESRDAGGRSQRERGGTPPGYRKVLRLLENRQEPITREHAEALAAEAYELDAETVATAIDHAVEYGRLREVDGQLKS